MISLWRQLSGKWRLIKDYNLGEILGHAKNYLFGNVATQALGLVSMPVFTRLLSREDYGIVAVYTVTIGLATTLTTLNATDGISRYYYEDARNDFGAFLSSVLQLVIMLLIPVIGVLLIWKEETMNLLGLPPGLVYFVAVGLLHGAAIKVFRQVNISRKNSKEFVRVNIVEGYFGFGLSWALLAFIDRAGYLLRILGISLVQALSTIWMVFRTWSYVSWQRMRWEHIRYSLHFSLPRLPYVLSGLILSQFDRIMLSNILGVESAGLYSVGYKVGALSLLVITAITPAFMPNFYQLMNAGKSSIVDKLNRQLLWLVSFVGIGLMLFGGYFLRFLADESFHQGASIIPAVVMGYMFYALTGVYNRYCGFYKQTILQSVGALAAGGVNIWLNYLWIPVYGIIAAAYATIIAYFIQSILTWGLVAFFSKGHVTNILGLVWPLVTVGVVFGIMELIVFN